MDRFVLVDVVDWLEATGRGREGEVRADAVAFASPAADAMPDEGATLEALAALLCLKAATDRELVGLSLADVRALARRADPDDQLLCSEVSALEDVRFLQRADELSEAAYGPAAALDGLVERQRRAGGGTVELSPQAHRLVVILAAALAREGGHEPPVYADATDHGSDLLLSIAKAEAAAAVEVVLSAASSRRTRALHRRLVTHEVHVQTAVDVKVSSPVVLIAHHADPSVARERILDELDDLVVSMTSGQRGLVLAPASLLTDRLRDRGLHQLRSRILRTGGVRAVVRLPAGLAPRRPREPLAMWVLGPDHSGGRPQDRPIALVDVSARALDDVVVDQLRDDVLATLGAPALRRARHFALARRVPTSTVLAQSGSLFPAVTTVVTEPRDGAALAVRVERLRGGADLRSDPLNNARVQVHAHDVPPPTTLGQAREQRKLRVVPGNREGFVLAADGTMPILGVEELTGQRDVRSRHLDRLAFLGSHPAARLTEPDDVVFCISPRPRALVDSGGGSAVPYPARVLRIDPADGDGLCPRVLAHAINALPERPGPCRGWLLPRVAPGQATPLSDALHALDRHQTALRERLDELDHLRGALVLAVTSGALTLADPKDD